VDPAAVRLRPVPDEHLLLTASLEGWQSSQRVAPDGAVESEQRATLLRPVVPATDEGARRLGDEYWQAVRLATLGLVRPHATTVGPELRALGIALLRFGPPDTMVEEGRISCAFAIRGGLLVRRPGGTLTLAQTDGPEIRSTIAGFHPRLAGPLYSQVQSRFHLAVSRRYFRQLVRR
jgi:hypothetical protein